MKQGADLLNDIRQLHMKFDLRHNHYDAALAVWAQTLVVMTLV